MSREYGGQHLAFLELSRRYKSDLISLRLGRNNVIVVCGQKGIQAVLKGEEYDGRPWDEFIKLRNMGMRKGILKKCGTLIIDNKNLVNFLLSLLYIHLVIRYSFKSIWFCLIILSFNL